ncbi:FAD-dependent oxidoreductase [Desulfolucanica intricata]|uniref:FAD-dependent oxidoreductase n=1 Tax=Desulfolucanica intricata TaxID=1285191 RepID=UPI00082EBB58|nr:FAD-dependent oxidoreductase [Desulfolucanica intricata]
MTKKIGAYICTGCGIGEALDIDALTKVASKEYKADVCKTHSFLCGQEGVDIINKDITGEGVNTVVIAGCSSRVKYDVFNFGPEVLVERVNLREQVVWTHPADDEDTTMLAEDYLRMGMVKAKAAEIPTPYVLDEPSKDILVIGGGLTGMTSAIEAAKAGYRVVLVEKESELGGWMAGLYKQAPLKQPFNNIEENCIEALAAEVQSNSNIKVYTSAKVAKTAGGPGMFDITIEQNGNEVAERVGSIILATGAVPYDASNLGHLGFGKCQNVITQAQFEELAKKGAIARPSDGKEVERVAFIQCAGSRDPEHLPYCSAACCIESLKQTAYLKELNPEAQALVFYKDIRSSGQYEHLYKKVQEDGVIFIKSEVTGITEDDSNNLVIEADDVILGEKIIAEEIDLVVLANGMVPSTANVVQPVVAASDDDKQEAEAEAAVAVEKDTILNLAYRQGPELPNLKYGFPDSHFICFPYETRRTGIYAAGSVRAPMDLCATVEDATGAALKAIQCVEATAVGAAVHPRAMDMSYPEFNMNRCTQCKRCTEECPFGAINEDDKSNPLPNPTRCRRCGTCMGACPERIISFKNYSVPMIGNMIKAIEVPEELEEKPRILIFACENDAVPAIDMAGISRLNYNAWVRVIPLRCLGSLNLVWIADAMSGGFDGILLLGCKHGDDYQCHFMKGSELAEIRLSKVSETLDRLGLESERVRFRVVNIMEYKDIPKIIDEFAEDLEEFGPNPMKDFA